MASWASERASVCVGARACSVIMMVYHRLKLCVSERTIKTNKPCMVAERGTLDPEVPAYCVLGSAFCVVPAICVCVVAQS